MTEKSARELELEKYIEDMERGIELPEAGGVAWTDLYGIKKDAEGNSHSVRINLTSRGATSTSALEGLIGAIKVAGEKYKLTPYDPGLTIADAPKAAPVPAKAAESPAATGAPVPAAGAAVEKVATQPPGGGVINAVKIVVTPRTDGKVSVGFFAAGRKFPDISAVRPPEQFAVEFSIATGAEWTPEHFAKTCEYALALKVTWAQGKPNSSGGFYKDIIGLAV